LTKDAQPEGGDEYRQQGARPRALGLYTPASIATDKAVITPTLMMADGQKVNPLDPSM
jgi:hypothetical protein